MIHPIHILALSQPGFVRQQVRNVLCGGKCDRFQSSFWRSPIFSRT